MAKPLQYIGQGFFYALFMGVIGYFSTYPVYAHLPPDETLIKLSFRHAGQIAGECRERTQEEMDKLPMYQRKGGTKVCPRGRSDLVVELEMDGKQLYHEILRPTGLAHSSNANIYRRIPVKAGVHTLKARLKDRPGDDFNYVREETVNLAAGRILVRLGIASLVGAGLFAILLVLARTPYIQDFFPWVYFFHTPLVVHVDLSVLLWFLAFAGVLWSLNSSSRFLGVGWLALVLAAGGAAIIVLSPFVAAGKPLMSNYVPVIQSTFFFTGLIVFAVGLT